MIVETSELEKSFSWFFVDGYIFTLHRSRNLIVRAPELGDVPNLPTTSILLVGKTKLSDDG